MWRGSSSVRSSYRRHSQPVPNCQGKRHLKREAVTSTRTELEQIKAAQRLGTALPARLYLPKTKKTTRTGKSKAAPEQDCLRYGAIANNAPAACIGWGDCDPDGAKSAPKANQERCIGQRVPRRDGRSISTRLGNARHVPTEAGSIAKEGGPHAFDGRLEETAACIHAHHAKLLVSRGGVSCRLVASARTARAPIVNGELKGRVCRSLSMREGTRLFKRRGRHGKPDMFGAYSETDKARGNAAQGGD